MEVYECSFCKSKIELGTGKMFVKRDGSPLYFCSSKCEKNMLKLGRVSRRVRWTGPRPEKKAEPVEAPKPKKVPRPKKTSKAKKGKKVGKGKGTGKAKGKKGAKGKK